MKLKKYLDKIGQKQCFFARLVGVTRQTICKYCSERQAPNRFIQEKIERLTGGIVTIDDWTKKDKA